VIRETTWFNDNLVPSNLPATFRKPTYVEGPCLALVSEFAAFNFGHMLLDALSRAQIPHECGVGMDQIDHFYLYRPTSDTGWQMLDSLGISREKCIWAEDVEMVVADKLLVTTFPGTRRNYHPIVTRALKRPLQKCPSASPKRRFYVPRTGARSVENEDELISIVRRYGFEVYDYRHEPDEFAAFADAKIVVGAHGSDIALIGAAGSGSTLLELVPSDHMHPYFYSLALGAGVEYHCIVGLSEEHRESMEGGASRVSFKICPSSEHLAQLAA
jgi:capsular polysaccharide biosynthesis protein